MAPTRGTALPEHPVARWSLIAVGAIVAVHLVAFAVLLVLQADHRGEVASNVVVDGIEVGGLSESELRSTVDDRAAQRRALLVEVTADGDSHTSELDVLGVSYEKEPAIDAVWNYGRGWLWSALREQIERRRGPWYEVELPRTVDHRALDRWAEATAQELQRGPRSASVGFVVSDGDVEIEVTGPEDGRVIDADALAEEALQVVGTGQPALDGPVGIEAPIQGMEPPTVTQADLDAALTDAESVISDDVVFELPARTNLDDLVLEPADLARILSFETEEAAAEGERLRLVADADALSSVLGDDGFDPFRGDPEEAEIEIVDDEVEIRGGTSGFEPDADGILDQVATLARAEGDERRGELPGEVIDPDLTREDAEELGIEQQVSHFSTPLVPGQPRNINLGLAADYLDGSLILPGERFSLNEAIGERTEERGFVENGFIDEDGDLVSVLGGGVSQMGTTFMNAAWFAGIEIVEFQPHSLYFERYPMGREATLSWGWLDVVVVNDSPYGILVTSEGAEEELEVTFWSSPWAEVETETGDPYDEEEGEERDGFTVDFERTITYPDGSSTTETYTHTYEPQDEEEDEDDD